MRERVRRELVGDRLHPRRIGAGTPRHDHEDEDSERHEPDALHVNNVARAKLAALGMTNAASVENHCSSKEQ